MSDELESSSNELGSSTTSSELESPAYRAPFFQRHPNVRMGLAVTALVIGLAAIALATVATCGVAGILGGAAASIAATLTFGASLTTVGAVAGGVGLFGGLSAGVGTYLLRGSIRRSGLVCSVEYLATGQCRSPDGLPKLEKNLGENKYLPVKEHSVKNRLAVVGKYFLSLFKTFEDNTQAWDPAPKPAPRGSN